MPELPEVEVTRRSFASAIAGATIVQVRLGQPLRWPLGCAPEQLCGLRVQQVRRRGKYLLLDLAPSAVLLIHLGMSGRLVFALHLPPAGTHDHCDLHTDRGILRLHDPRRFGAVVWAASEQAPIACKLLGALGMEPLEPQFTAHALHSALQTRRAAIKQVLLAGRVVVGVGNIYASEVLFLAGIDPRCPACAIDSVRSRRLHEAIRAVLHCAIEHGGTTLKDFASADGAIGHFQTQTRVYGREGQPCSQCGHAIERLVQGQRASYFCPHCQR
jgi:formamidopyrimidine-DNA glycosylase